MDENRKLALQEATHLVTATTTDDQDQDDVRQKVLQAAEAFESFLEPKDSA